MKDRMMNNMIGNMAVKDREDLMCKIMPIMMKDADINKMMPSMLKEMGDMITLGGLVSFIIKLSKDDDIKSELNKLQEVIKNRLPDAMIKMQPMMQDIMLSVMPKMMGFMGESIMPVMMPVMSKTMPAIMKEKIPDIIKRNPSIKECMTTMMPLVMPYCKID